MNLSEGYYILDVFPLSLVIGCCFLIIYSLYFVYSDFMQKNFFFCSKKWCEELEFIQIMYSMK